MTIHSALCAQFAEREADGVPWVLCGDFNIKPSDLQYQLLTEGQMDPQHPQYATGCACDCSLARTHSSDTHVGPTD